MIGEKNSFSKIYFVLICMVVFSSCRTSNIYNATNIPISPPATATLDELSQAVWLASWLQGWQTEDISPGVVQGVYKIRNHKAIVSINFDKSHFNIVYLDSANLKYDGNNIHVTYNLWIQELEKKIQNLINVSHK